MAEFDDERANGQLPQYFHHDRDGFGISNHRAVSTGNVKVALVELPPPSALGLRLVATVTVQSVTTNHRTNTRQRTLWLCDTA